MSFSKTGYAALSAATIVFTMGLAQGASQTLQNHVPQAVRESQRLGPLSETARLALAVGLPLRHREELDALVEQISNPGSPHYRQYLTASEFAARFGPSQEDYDKLIRFVEANGFTVSGKHPNRMLLDVTGSVAAINRTLHVSLTAWDHPTRGRFFAPDRDPSLDLDVQVLNVSGLDNSVVPRPMDLKSIPLTSQVPFVSGSGPSGLFLGRDFRAAYAPGVTMTGAGQTIGLVEFDGFYAADVTTNFQLAGLPAVPVQTVLLDGFNGSPGNSNIEVILDIVMAGYMAPGASIVVYEGSYPNDVLNRMATDNTARQLSCSWGYGIDSTTEQIFLQMIAQGQSFFTASGDSGAYAGPIMPPADDPNVTSVGGTALTTSGPGGSWLAESAWSGSGGGISTSYPIPGYQKNTNMAAHGGSNAMRNMPDVALTGAVQMFLVFNNGQQTAVGGTSAATPLWAAFTALANQQAAANQKPALGFLNPALYTLGNGSSYSSTMHDIVTGSNGFSTMPGFDLATGWGSPSGQPLIDALTSSSTSSPSFTLSATPSAVSVQPGSSVTTSIQVTAQNGFSGAVVVSAPGLPSGVTASFGAFDSSLTSTLTLTASSGATPGNDSISIQGVSGSLTASSQMSLTVTGAGSFSLKTSLSALTLNQSGAGAATIAIAPANGFTGSVNLTVSGLTSGLTASFSPASSATTSTLSFSANAGATLGKATVTVTGKSGSLSSTVTLAVTVVVPAVFSLSTSTPALTLVQGANAASTITVTPKNGTSNKVTLAMAGLPSGVTASFNPASTATTSVVTFTATSAATVGTTSITVTGTYGTSTTSVAFNLTVKSGASFTFTAAPSSLSLVQGASGTSTITVVPVNGFTGTPAFTVGGLPSGVSANFTPGGSGGTLTIAAGASAATGPATLTVTATSGALSAQATIALTVTAAPGFKLSSSLPSFNLLPGSSSPVTITVTPQGGFSGTVALTVTGLPTGITASFNPSSTASTSTLTITAAGNAGASVSTLSVNGTSGSLTAAVPITVTVTPPDFTMALAPTSLRVLQAGQGAAAVNLTPFNGFAGTVTLTASGLPSGVTASFSAVNSSLILGLFTAASSATAGTSQVTLAATSGALSHVAVLNLTVAAPSTGTTAVDLSPSYNVSGSAIDNLPFTTGGLDALGRSYSGVLLGASQLVGTTLFGLGPMGLPDVVSGQTVTLPAGQFGSLKMLATGVNGNQPGQTFTVTYTDGSTTAFTQSLSDWYTAQNYTGESLAMATNYRDNSTGTTDGRVFNLYTYSFNLNAAKTVRSIALPQNRNVVVLALTLLTGTNAAGTALADLSKVFNGVGITSDGKAFTGGLDGVGYAYSGSLLQGPLTVSGVQVQWGAADQLNVVSNAGKAIPLPVGKYSSLLVVGTAVNGSQLSQPFKITYTDGTIATATQSLSDWFTPSSFPGEATALTMTYRNAASGARDNRKFQLYQYTVSLNNSKSVSSITLPANSNVKVFAMGLKP